MSFSEDIKIKAMVACGRRCCICHKFCGNNMEVHHIKARADGGEDVFENAIPLCFDCHAIVRQYDPRHPKGIKFTEKELIMHRDTWYNKIEKSAAAENNGMRRNGAELIEEYYQNDYQKNMLQRISDGKELMSFIQRADCIIYDEEARNIEEAKIVGDFIQYVKELMDIEDLIEEPSERIITGFELTESIQELDKNGFWVFVGIEKRKLTCGVRTINDIPVLLMRVIRKDNNEIIKKYVN